MLTVHVPTLPEALLTLLEAGMIGEDEAKRYFANFKTFEANVCTIKAQYDGQWAAALNGRIYHAPTQPALMTTIAQHADWQQAYYEHVGRIT